MAWDLENDRPIYAQLVERIQVQIVSGEYPPGGKLPSVRELAAVAAVNPNTMQKAFAELEKSGLIVTQRTNGRTVTEDRGLIQDIKRKLARRYVDAFYTGMRELGYTEVEALHLLGGMGNVDSTGKDGMDSVGNMSHADNTGDTDSMDNAGNRGGMEHE